MKKEPPPGYHVFGITEASIGKLREDGTVDPESVRPLHITGFDVAKPDTSRQPLYTRADIQQGELTVTWIYDEITRMTRKKWRRLLRLFGLDEPSRKVQHNIARRRARYVAHLRKGTGIREHRR